MAVSALQQQRFQAQVRARNHTLKGRLIQIGRNPAAAAGRPLTMKRHLTRFREWCRYRRLLGALVRADRREKRQLDPERIGELKDQARVAAAAAGRRG